VCENEQLHETALSSCTISCLEIIAFCLTKYSKFAKVTLVSDESGVGGNGSARAIRAEEGKPKKACNQKSGDWYLVISIWLCLLAAFSPEESAN
jgi:hypothetical protein